MEIINYANGKGQAIKLDQDEAKELIRLLEKALEQGVAESAFINTTIELEY